MKKRIVSMILALSMMLSILPVSAFADAGAGLPSAAAEETNSIAYSSENEYEAVGTNSETNNQVVKIKIAAGLPKAQTGTGWSYDETTGLTITGTGNEDTEYILDGTVSCNVTVKNADNYTVYLLDGAVTGTLLIEASYMRGVYVLGGSYTNVVLNRGTIDGGTYDKLTENEGYVLGGFFRDINGLSASTQQQAHKLLLPKGCTLNGQKEKEIYIIKQYYYIGNGNALELVVESDTSCGAWAVASTGGSVMALPAGTTDYNFTYGSMTIASVSISPDGKTLSASFSALPLSDNAPMELAQIPSVNKELRFTNEGLPDLTGMTYVDSLDEDENLHRVYMGNGWAYNCYPNDKDNRKQNIVQILDQSSREINFKELSPAPISCAVQVTNATITDADFGQTGALVLTSGKITGGTYHNANVGINSINGNGKVEITGGTFDYLYCNSSCSISNAVIQSCGFNTYDNNTYTISDTVLGELPDGIQNLLPAGQQLSKLVVRNGNVTAMNGRNLPLSVNTIYLVGEGSAELTLNTKVLSINGEAVENYNASTHADGKVLHITGNNDGAEIFVNKSTDLSDLKPLRITENGLPDLTGVTGVPMTGEGMTINLYEGLGWKYATTEEDGVERTALYITTPDGNPVDLSSDTINPYHVAIAVEEISLVNVTVTGIVAGGSVHAENAIIQDGTFQKDVYADDNSTIAGGSFQDIVRADGMITGGVFHDVQLSGYTTEKRVIQNAVILGSLKMDSGDEVAVSNTVSCNLIKSEYLADGQQQSKLMITDGTVDAVNGHAVTADAVYLVGNTAVTITFSKAVTNINGKAVSAYDANAQLSADSKTLTLTAKNDGEPIVVNVAASGKLPFSVLTEDDFDIDRSTLVPGITCKKDGVGKPSIVFVRTYDGKEFDHLPSQDEYGIYKVYIRAEAGTLYEGGELQIDECTRKYQPTSTDFNFDLKNGTATYKGQKYFGDAVPQATLKYSATNDWLAATEKVPTEAGTYYVWLDVKYDDYYNGGGEQLPDRYTVSGKLPFESLDPKDFDINVDDDGNYTVVCKTADGVGELSTKLECLTGVNKGKTYINRDPGEDVYGRYRGSIVAEEGEKYKAGSIVVVEETIRYTPKATDFAYDAATKTVKYKGENYYDADPDMTLLYGTDQSETLPTTPGSYDVYVRVTADENYIADADADDDYRIYQVGTYTVADGEKLPFDGFTREDFKPIGNGDGTYTLVCTKADGVGELTVKFECITGVNKGKTFINRDPDIGAYGRYQVTITAKEGTKYKPGSIELDQYTIRYTPEAADFTYDATKNTVTYNIDKNYYDADPKMTPLYGTDQSETVPTAPGSYDVYVKVTAGKNYIADADADDDYRIYQVGTYVVPKTYKLDVTDAKVTLKDGSAVADLTAVPKGTELVATAPEKEGYTFDSWEKEGLPADANIDGATITFKMPANNVTLKAKYTENAPETYELKVSDAKVTLKDGSAVADLTAVPVGTELVATAPEKDGFTFDSWEKDGLPADANIDGATITFKMPANNVTLTPHYTENAPKKYTVTMGEEDTEYAVDADVSITAPEKDGFTFSYWEAEGVPEGTDTSSETITFKMPANNVTLTPHYTENAPKKYTVTMGEEGTEYAVDADVSITAPKKDGFTFSYWEAEGVPEGTDTTSETITFKMPANNVTLTPHYTENAPKKYTVTMDEKDTEYAVDADVSITAPEKDGYTFTGWEVTGLPADVDTTKATITFTMPANNVTLKPQYTEIVPEKYTVTMGEKVTEYAVDADVSITAPKKDGYTFTGWEVTGLPADVDTTKATITFKMPANNVTLKPQYTENASKTYKLDVSYATITLKDGSAVADLTAVPEGTELVATADEDTETSVFKSWSCTGLELTKEQSTARVVEFTMPDHDVNLTAVFGVPTKPDDPTPAPGGDSDGGGAIVMVAAVGGAAVGVGAYIAGTTAYLKSVLPEGMAIPANRQQLAVALWTAAGKPATQSTALFNDVAADAAELQAIRWVVDTGLMSAQDGNFKPGSRVGRMEVIRTWKAYQQRG